MKPSALSNVTISNGAGVVEYTPEFDPDTVLYTGEFDADEITITLESPDPDHITCLTVTSKDPIARYGMTQTYDTSSIDAGGSYEIIVNVENTEDSSDYHVYDFRLTRAGG